MRKFVLQILVLLIILIMIALPVDYMITMGLRKVHGIEFSVWNDIYNGNNMDNDLVVLGASTAWTSYNTYMMDSILGMNTYNLGIDGHPWYMYKIRYNTYSEVAELPKYIVINLDKSTFCEKLDNPYMREQFLPYPKLMRKIWVDKEYSLVDIFIPYCRYMGYGELQKTGIRKFFNKKVDPWFEEESFYKGYFGQEKGWDITGFNDTIALSTRPALACSRLVKEDIVKFIKERQKEGVQVVLCRYPIYIPYFRQCKDVDKFENLCHEICEETNIPLFDFSNIDIANDTSYFYNPTHLNIKGAKIYTDDFCLRFKEWND